MKKISHFFLSVASIILCTSIIQSCSTSGEEKWINPYARQMKWWTDARLGMFICWSTSTLESLEMSWDRERFGREKYDRLYRRFNPVNFNPDQWIDVAEDMGAKYIVFTTKHHDGFCFFDTKTTEYSIMHTPYGKDVCRLLADAAHRRNMKLGWYYSVREWDDANCSDSVNNHLYVDKLKSQIRELLTNYGKIDLLWFDYDGWPSPVNPNEMFEYVQSLQPDIVINNRLYPLTPTESSCYVGPAAMYATPEQSVGTYAEFPWECCSTSSRCRGWSCHYDPPRPYEDILWEIIGSAGGNGNMLMNVAPDSLGVMTDDYANTVRHVGDWIRRYDGILYGTHGGPWYPTPEYVSTYKGSTAYLVIRKAGREISLPYSDCLNICAVSFPDMPEAKAETVIECDTLRIKIPDKLTGISNLVIKIESGKDFSSAGEPLRFYRTTSLTTGCRANASSSMSIYRHNAEAAVDGDPDTYWITGRRTPIDSCSHYGKKYHFNGPTEEISMAFNTDGWLEVDLGSIRKVSSFSVRRGGDPIDRVSIQYKNGNNWIETACMENMDIDWKGSFKQPVGARYWRLDMKGGKRYWGIGEFQLFE